MEFYVPSQPSQSNESQGSPDNAEPTIRYIFNTDRAAPRSLHGFQREGHRRRPRAHDARRGLATSFQRWFRARTRGGPRLLDGAVERDQSARGAAGFSSGGGRTD